MLGRLGVSDGEGGHRSGDDLPRRARQVLGVLAARHDRLLSKDAIADAVWGDDLPGNHVAALEHYVSLIRRELQPGRRAADSFIVTRDGGYLLCSERIQLDLAELRRLVRLADAEPADSAERVRLRHQILGLTDGLPFEEEDAQWAEALRTEVREAIVTALIEVAAAAVDGEPERALRHARTAIELDAFLEQPYRIAMRAAARLGRTDEAMRWYERCRRTLDEELGIPPSPETSQLRRELLAGRASRPDAVARSDRADRPARRGLLHRHPRRWLPVLHRADRAGPRRASPAGPACRRETGGLRRTAVAAPADPRPHRRPAV